MPYDWVPFDWLAQSAQQYNIPEEEVRKFLSEYRASGRTPTQEDWLGWIGQENLPGEVSGGSSQPVLGYQGEPHLGSKTVVPDDTLAAIRESLGRYAREGYGTEWMRQQMYAQTAGQQLPVFERMRQIGASEAATGFADSGYHERLRKYVDYARKQAIQRVWSGIRSANEEVKQTAARQLADLNEFYKRLQEQGKLEDWYFDQRMQLQRERLQREAEIAKREFWGNLLQNALGMAGQILPFI